MSAHFVPQSSGGAAVFGVMVGQGMGVVDPLDGESTTEPREVRAGDSLSWRRQIDACPANAGWALVYRMVPRGSGTAVNIPTVPGGAEFLARVLAGTSASWQAGEYTLVGVCVRGTSRVTVYTGPCTVLPDLMTVSGFDSRSVPRQIVDAIDEYFRTRDKGVLEKQLGDRRLRFQTDAELLATRNHYARQLVAEAAAANIANGLGVSPTRVQVRM